MRDDINRAKKILEGSGYTLKKKMREGASGGSFENAGYKWDILDTKGDYTLVHAKDKKLQPYVVAWKLDPKDHSWSQGHYFNDEKKARDYLAKTKKNEGLDEADVRLSREDMNNPDKISLKDISKKAVDKEKSDNARRSMEEKYDEVIKEIETSEDPIQKSFDLLVPSAGPADTVAGELSRAINRILHRDYNDGDVFYDGYGVETCAPAVAYILSKLPLEDLFEEIANKRLEDDDYTQSLNLIAAKVVDSITSDINLFKPNTEDMLDTSIEFIEEWIPTYEFETSFPDSIDYHIRKDHIGLRELQGEISEWDGLRDAEIEVTEYGVYIDGLRRDDYDEVSHSMDKWLEQYGEDLDNEYGSEEDDNDDEEDEDYEEEEYEDEED